MLIDILKHTVVNVCKSVTYGMKKPDTKFFECIFKSMLEYRTTVLSTLGDTKQKKAKGLLKYFSRGLGREGMRNLPDKVCRVLVRFIGKVDSETLFCFDGVDVNKNSAKKMEGLQGVRDGSTGTFGNEYIFNSVSVHGIPFLFDREEICEGTGEGNNEKEGVKDKKAELSKRRFQIFSEQVGKIISLFGDTHWIAVDQLYDDVKKFNLLMEKKMKFVIRMKTNRRVIILAQEPARPGEKANEDVIGKTIPVGDIGAGRYMVTKMA